MENIILASIIVFVAAILQACTGFGFSIMATPFLLFVFEPHVAIQINIILSIVISIFLVPRVRKEVDKSLLKRLIVGSALGCPIGILIFIYLDAQLLKVVTGLLIIGLTILLFLSFHIKRSIRKDGLAGGFSGLLTTSIGMPGPPIIIYFIGASIQKEVIRSTTLTFYLYVYSISLSMQLVFSSTTKEIWVASVWLLPITFVGMFIGHQLFHYINEHLFQRIMYLILSVTGIYLIISSL
ncbi:sulfite exporter TauE/SafE family protein [Halalkalibacter krulwichiae]|uniref:Probable membrane transporter protein n=1 Tax=Halalkalibacter krulwichiae TaxID=199441 RepID=A0A1X9MH61_9BACI|nr:sulfite exporter TauE/SafE family protein [Halalkalibacter krulwichiae]ARK29772.1 Sulfite exporter TauE/SafE [Halalkalibacter krulwichiae]